MRNANKKVVLPYIIIFFSFFARQIYAYISINIVQIFNGLKSSCSRVIVARVRTLNPSINSCSYPRREKNEILTPFTPRPWRTAVIFDFSRYLRFDASSIVKKERKNDILYNNNERNAFDWNKKKTI